jgi:16S rRNA (guanine966-N2)-methyltransferase
VRIIGGALRGRRLLVKPGPPTRPTSDRVREAIASALDARGWIANAHVLDLFAGTGALAFESLSRGAKAALLVDNERPIVEAIRRDAAQLGLSACTEVLELDLLGAPRRVEAALRRSRLQPFNLTFADAPYARVDDAVALLARLAHAGVLAPHSSVVVEYAQRSQLIRPDAFEEVASYRYGDSAIALWETVSGGDQT